MVNLTFDPLVAAEVRAAHAVTTGLMALYEEKAPMGKVLLDAQLAAAKKGPLTKEQIAEETKEGTPERVEEETAAIKASADTAEVDARNMPWDKRIHASTKTFLANGNWKNKRGVDADRLVEVEAELLGTAANGKAEDHPEPTGQAPTSEQEPEAVTIEDVRDALAVKANANREAILAKLTDLNTKSVTFMKPEDYPEFLTFLEGLE